MTTANYYLTPRDLTTNPPTGGTAAVRPPLVKICDDILWAMERQSITAIVAIDLRAALDTVDHDILLDVLDRKDLACRKML